MQGPGIHWPHAIWTINGSRGTELAEESVDEKRRSGKVAKRDLEFSPRILTAFSEYSSFHLPCLPLEDALDSQRMTHKGLNSGQLAVFLSRQKISQLIVFT